MLVSLLPFLLEVVVNLVSEEVLCLLVIELSAENINSKVCITITGALLQRGKFNLTSFLW